MIGQVLVVLVHRASAVNFRKVIFVVLRKKSVFGPNKLQEFDVPTP